MMHEVDETTADGQVPPGHPTALSLRMAIRRFRPLLTGLRWRLVAAILCYLVHVATTVVTVAVFAHIVDDVLITGDLSALLDPLLVWIAASLIGAAASYAGAVLTGGGSPRNSFSGCATGCTCTRNGSHRMRDIDSAREISCPATPPTWKRSTVCCPPGSSPPPSPS